MSPQNVFTIAPGLPFVDVLAAGIRARAGDDPAALAGVTVLVPTQRARRSLAEAFLRQSGGQALLLPRTIALGDMDEDEILLSGGGDGSGGLAGKDLLQIPEAASGLERQLLLTRLVLARDNASPDQAANLALELAHLLDQVHTERLSFKDLHSLVPDEYAVHWRETLEFLTVLTELWPGILEDNDAIDDADRRNRLFDAQGQAWKDSPPSGPVIAAGSTGSIPATADLLCVIAAMEQGAVVLPGLDMDATDSAWAALEDHHPQYGMARLLTHFGIERKDVRSWDAPGFDAVQPDRARLMQTALTPAGTEPPPLPDIQATGAALEGVTRILCPTPREEAAVIALMMRETLETPEKTAALVTPDRGLARRVAAELARWDIDIDDSAGLPLAQTPTGAFLRLTARMIADDLAPASLLAALKHPLAAGGMPAGVFRDHIRTLETTILRGPRPAPGIDGLLAAIDADRFLNKKENHGTANRLRSVLGRLRDIFEPFRVVMDGSTHVLSDMAARHVRVAEALCATEDETGEPNGAGRLWAGDAGEGAARFIADLARSGQILKDVTGADYPPLLDTLMAGRVVRPRFGRHPRLHIWGLLEARLQQADLMILGGLNESAWPPEAKASPWMSRPMMARFGLPAPERRIGLAAHDFCQAFSAPNVVLTRSERVDGTPTVPSRWLLRLDNLLEKQGLEKFFEVPASWLQWVEKIDRPDKSRTVTEPKPCPPVEARPRELPVTRIETWLRDPYAVYARNILELKALDPLDAEPGAADRGIIVHEVLDRFQKAHPDTLPDDAERRLLEIGQDVFDQQLAHPGVRAFWWPRFERIAEWFIAYERERRALGFHTVGAEVNGHLTLPGKAGDFRLTARADRIDARADIGLSVMDYKTGTVPTAPQVETGLTPQLSLEAAIAQAGGFEDIAAAPVAHLVYLKLSGGREPGKERVLKLDPADVADEAVARLSGLVARFDDPKTPYLSSRRPMFQGRSGDYDHLARVKEWRGQDGDGNDG